MRDRLPIKGLSPVCWPCHCWKPSLPTCQAGTPFRGAEPYKGLVGAMYPARAKCTRAKLPTCLLLLRHRRRRRDSCLLAEANSRMIRAREAAWARWKSASRSCTGWLAVVPDGCLGRKVAVFASTLPAPISAWTACAAHFRAATVALTRRSRRSLPFCPACTSDSVEMRSSIDAIVTAYPSGGGVQSKDV